MLERIEAVLRDFGKSHPEVLGIFVFGSQAAGRQRDSSDVDVALYVDPPALGENSLDLRLTYIVELETALRKQVDVVVLNEAGPVLRHQVFRKGRLVFERDRTRVRRFIGDALIEFYDEIVTLEAMRKTMIRRHLLGR